LPELEGGYENAVCATLVTRQEYVPIREWLFA